MALGESISRMAGTLLAIVQTRLELASVELEEEALRFFSWLLLSLIALFCGFVAVLLAILLILALFWDTHRIAVIVGMIVAFGGAAMLLALGIRSSFRGKPRLLAYTRAELAKDVEHLHPMR